MIEEKEHIVAEEEEYLIYDPKTGETNVITSFPSNLSGKFFRKIHGSQPVGANTYNVSQIRDGFVDKDFHPSSLTVQSQDPNQKVVFKRLQHLYPKKHRPSFFPTAHELPRLKNSDGAPHFMVEIGLSSTEHYKSMFITQDFQESGRYEMVVNVDGRFEAVTVDDYVPVYENTEEPIWGMELKYPWQLIIVKVWAKRCKGYDNILSTDPMDFLSSFTNSNWKYFNLAREPGFLDYFQGKKWGEIVLKTKDNPDVRRSGLAPNEVGYKLINIQKTESDFTVVIKSTVKNKWSGTMSVVDRKVNTLGSMLKSTIPSTVNLDRDIFLNKSDFYNMFSAAYITSTRPHAVSNYYILEVQPHNKNALYLEFHIKEDSFLDFSVKQRDENLKNPNKGSRIRHAKYQEDQGKEVKEEEVMRYHHVKYALIFNVAKTKKQYPELFQESTEGNGELNDYDRSRRERLNNEKALLPLDYDCYEIEYQKGYNKGEAHFLNLEKGWYLLRIKPERSEVVTRFVFNYTTSRPIQVREVDFSNQERSLLLRQAIISISERVSSVFLGSNKTESVAFGNEFENIGYGFVTVKVEKQSKTSVLLEVQPK